MRYLIALAFLFLAAQNVGADTDAYLVETDEGVAVTYYQEGSVDTPSDALIAAGFGEFQARPLDKADIPNDLEEDRDFWYYNPANKKIEVDKAKKKLYDDEVAADEAERDAILKKLTDAIPGLTADDLESIGVKKDVKSKKEK